jgi:hypothetical protein
VIHDAVGAAIKPCDINDHMATTKQKAQQDTTTVRMPRSLIEQLRKLAKAHDRSLSAELRVALAAYINDHKRRGGA